MVKKILLQLDDEKFFALKYFKGLLEKENKKGYKWEEFLCDWVISLFQRWMKVEVIDKALEEAMQSIKPEDREKFKRLVMDCITDKLRYYE